jgi:acetolactate synthase I/II/III large subunit
MKGYEAIADGLIAEGVDTIFGLMAIDNMPFMTYLQAQGLRVIRARTEHGAICMADGYARTTGQPGVVSVGDGPGAAMTGTALLTARRRKSPLVLICGDTPALERHNIKQFDQDTFFEVTAGHCVSVADTGTIAEDLGKVFRHVRSGLGPSVLNCPLNLFEEEITRSWNYKPAPRPIRQRPDPQAVEQAVATLADAQRPVILAGRGAVAADAKDELLRCAERIGALLGTSMQAQGLFGDDPHSLGIVGGLSSPATVNKVTQADAILAVGASLNPFTTGFGRLFPKAKIIHVDDQSASIGSVTPVNVAIVGDAKATVAEINQALDRHGVTGRQGFRTGENRAASAADRARAIPEYSAKSGVIDPREFLDIVDQGMPLDRTIVTDAGHAMFFVADHITPHDPTDRVWGADFAAMSVGIPLGIGAALGRPRKHTVVFVGDGGFMMSLPELDTAVREELPMTVVVLNDEAFGAEVHYLENWGLPTDIAFFKTPELAAVAASLGCESTVVRDHTDAKAAVQRIGTTTGPYVIDARTDVSVVHRLWVGAKRLSGGK